MGTNMSEITLQELKELYAKIPEFECIPGCTECCGPIPVSDVECAEIGCKNTHLLPLKYGKFDCAYSTEKGCAIYEKRPLMCRLFGTTQDLACPKGRQPKKMLSETEALEIMSGLEV